MPPDRKTSVEQLKPLSVNQLRQITIRLCTPSLVHTEDPNETRSERILLGKKIIEAYGLQNDVPSTEISQEVKLVQRHVSLLQQEHRAQIACQETYNHAEGLLGHIAVSEPFAPPESSQAIDYRNTIEGNAALNKLRSHEQQLNRIQKELSTSKGEILTMLEAKTPGIQETSQALQDVTITALIKQLSGRK